MGRKRGKNKEVWCQYSYGCMTTHTGAAKSPHTNEKISFEPPVDHEKELEIKILQKHQELRNEVVRQLENDIKEELGADTVHSMVIGNVVATAIEDADVEETVRDCRVIVPKEKDTVDNFAKQREEAMKKYLEKREMECEEYLKSVEKIHVICKRSLTKSGWSDPICDTAYTSKKTGPVLEKFKYIFINKSRNDMRVLYTRDPRQCPRCFNRLKNLIGKTDKKYFKQFRNCLVPVDPLPNKEEEPYEESDDDYYW